MGIELILGIWAVIASVIALLFWNKANATAPVQALGSGAKKAALPKAGEDPLKALEKKLAEARTEASGAKEKLQAKQKEFDEFKESARQKAKREGKKEAREAEDASKKGTDPRDVEIQSLRKGMAALESQLNNLKREQANASASATDRRDRTAAEVAGAKEAAAGERDKRQSIEQENAQLKATLDELRSAMKKADARPDVPGTALNLKELPTPAVQELSRFFRKGEEFERLYTVSQSQLQLEKDRYLELQRRYFAVCREMAVKTGAPVNASDAEIAKAAHEALEESAANGENDTREARGPRAAADGTTDAEGSEAAAGDGEKKKRRRRRRRKIAGESSEVEASDADGDDEDGDDDGHDGDEGNAPAAVAAAPAEAAKAEPAPAASAEPVVKADDAEATVASGKVGEAAEAAKDGDDSNKNPGDAGASAPA